VKFI